MSNITTALTHKPGPFTSFVVSAALVFIWLFLRLVVFHAIIFPLTYALPLLVCIWTRDKKALWAMAVIFTLAHTIKQFWILPADFPPASGDMTVYVSTLINIGVGALIVHAIILLRDELEGTLESLKEANNEIQAQGEELAQQNEELGQQNEELQAQSEQIEAGQLLLAHKEEVLQGLLDAARLSTSEEAVLSNICKAGREMLGEQVAAIGVYEKRQADLALRSLVGTDGLSLCPIDASDKFVELVMEENRTASLNDVSVRPDLPVLQAGPIGPFQSALSSPMRLAETPFGAVAVYSHSPQEWTDEQFALVEWLAGRASGIVESLRLKDELRRREERFRILSEASGVLLNTKEPQSVVDSLCRGTPRLPRLLQLSGR